MPYVVPLPSFDQLPQPLRVLANAIEMWFIRRDGHDPVDVASVLLKSLLSEPNITVLDVDVFKNNTIIVMFGDSVHTVQMRFSFTNPSCWQYTFDGYWQEDGSSPPQNDPYLAWDRAMGIL